MNARRDLYAALMAGGPHSPQRSEKASELIEAFRAEVLGSAGATLGELGFPNASALLADTAEVVAAAGSTLGHATRAESVPALLATISQLRDLRAPLIDALRTVHESMTSCVGDEWAEEWLGEVWSGLPLEVRALAGDQDATAEIAAAQGALPVPAGPHVTVTKAPDGGEDIEFTSGGAL